MVRAYNLRSRGEGGLGGSETYERRNHLVPGTQDDLSNQGTPNEEENLNGHSLAAPVV